MGDAEILRAAIAIALQKIDVRNRQTIDVETQDTLASLLRVARLTEEGLVPLARRQAGHQLLRVDRFGEVAVEAGFAGAALFVLGAVAGDRDEADGGRGGLLAEGGGQGVAVQAGQADVGDDDLGQQPPGRLQALGTGGRHRDLR